MTDRIQTTVGIDRATLARLEELRTRLTVGRIRPSLAEVVREALDRGLVAMLETGRPQ